VTTASVGLLEPYAEPFPTYRRSARSTTAVTVVPSLRDFSTAAFHRSGSMRRERGMVSATGPYLRQNRSIGTLVGRLRLRGHGRDEVVHLVLGEASDVNRDDDRVPRSQHDVAEIVAVQPVVGLEASDAAVGSLVHAGYVPVLFDSVSGRLGPVLVASFAHFVPLRRCVDTACTGNVSTVKPIRATPAEEFATGDAA